MRIGKTKKIYLVWFLIFLAWSIYRVSGTWPEWVDELIVKPLIFVLPILWLVVVKEKRSLVSLGLTFKNFFKEIYIGVGIGLLFASEGFLVNYIKYHTFSFVPIGALASVGLIPFLIFSVATSISEEILGRGYVYSRLYEGNHNQFKSAVIASFLFLLLHIPILFTRLNLMGMSLIVYLVSIFLLGVTNSYLYTYRKSLVVPILIHIFWNATVALYL